MAKKSDIDQFFQRRDAWIPAESFTYLQSLEHDHELDEGQSKAKQMMIAEAKEWLETKPFTVMNKKTFPPSQDKHDYMSLSIYNWPNPDTADGLPYVTRDGHVNPEIEDYDKPSLSDMVRAVECLTMVYTMTGELKWAAKAIELLDAWFLHPDTRMNPNMLYAQYIPGDGGFDRSERYPAVYVPGVEGKGIYVAFGGVIEGTRFVPLVNVIPYLEKCSIWTEEQANGIREWFRAYLFWLLESQHGKDESNCLNNHGSWYCTQIVTYALFAGEIETARRFLQVNVPKRIALQINPDGSLPEELVRAGPFHYVIFALSSFFVLAIQAEQLDIDLWNYQTEDGRGIRKAFDWFVPYFNNPTTWPYRGIHPIQSHFPETVPLLHMAYRAYKDPVYQQTWRDLPAYPENHPYRLLYPL